MLLHEYMYVCVCMYVRLAFYMCYFVFKPLHACVCAFVRMCSKYKCGLIYTCMNASCVYGSYMTNCCGIWLSVICGYTHEFI
jgi:hypothetical protein